MRSNLLRVVFGALSIFATADAMADPKIQAGLWEISIASSLAGTQLPAASQQLCFSDKDIADIKQLLPSGGSCNLNNAKISGNSGSWNFQCTGQLPTSGSIDLTFGSSSFSGKLTLTIATGGAMQSAQGDAANSSGNTTQISETVSAHRLGNCSN